MGVLTYTELPSKKITEVVWLGEVAAERRAPVCGEEMSHFNYSQVCCTVDLSSAANDRVSEDVAVITPHPLQVANHCIWCGPAPLQVANHCIWCGPTSSGRRRAEK